MTQMLGKGEYFREGLHPIYDNNKCVLFSFLGLVLVDKDHEAGQKKNKNDALTVNCVQLFSPFHSFKF